jgi:hypothetical protein
MKKFENLIKNNKVARYVFFGLLIVGGIGNVVIGMVIALCMSN